MPVHLTYRNVTAVALVPHKDTTPLVTPSYPFVYHVTRGTWALTAPTYAHTEIKFRWIPSNVSVIPAIPELIVSTFVVTMAVVLIIQDVNVVMKPNSLLVTASGVLLAKSKVVLVFPILLLRVPTTQAFTVTRLESVFAR
jgi:hypothetical protein